MDDALFGCPPKERAARYRALAEEMRSRAALAVTKETRLGYLNMAVDWLDMADKLDARYGQVSVIAEPEQSAGLRPQAR
jgi:hypothetical protein